MRSYEKSKAAFEEAQRVMPGGVNSPVRAFKSVNMDPIFMEREKGQKSMILTETNTSIMSCHGDRLFWATAMKKW